MGKIIKQSVIENVPFWILAGIAMAMGITAFFIPPMAEIHPSVLRFISWVFAFAALWTVFVSMMRGLDARIQHGNTSLTIGDIDKKDNLQQPSEQETEEEETYE
jgi:hypothetical protein